MAEPKKPDRKKTAPRTSNPTPPAGRPAKSNPVKSAKPKARPARPPEPAPTATELSSAGPEGAFGLDPWVRITEDRIRQRAYEIYQMRQTLGGAVADWLLAEQQLRAEARVGIVHIP